MKIQCNACERAEASVLCCADEAALCWACDQKIHAANKLASKHQRVPLSNSSSQMPRCDICQETAGYFFCLEDRALLCRKCDVAIHTANSYVSAHQRFLLTGVKVGLEPTEPIASSKAKSNSMQRTTEPPSEPSFKCGTSISLSGENNGVLVSQPGVGGGLPASKVSFSSCGTVPGIIPDWPLEDFLGLTDFSQNYGFMDQGSSKQADFAKLGDSEWSPIYRAAADEDLDLDECLGQVPEIPQPKIPSPPTATGLYWPKNFRSNHSANNSVFVPDICSPSLQNDHEYQLNTADVILKRRRLS
ncbi:B-box zinc finger protein 22-like isoform X2 [Magnolia sinica]|uniref:B-box zinc finger protein 22-like isoform X2 n=1 Tax=Magnolia sinica TaxID=86752 RepID=UPI002658096E|nr:B-box zinc finger protein 22-like isoform X2 [Magnolia sinica]